MKKNKNKKLYIPAKQQYKVFKGSHVMIKTTTAVLAGMMALTPLQTTVMADEATEPVTGQTVEAQTETTQAETQTEAETMAEAALAETESTEAQEDAVALTDRIRYFEVGETGSSAILVVSNGFTLLICFGPDASGLASVMKEEGVDHIDALILSSAEGQESYIYELQETCPIGHVYTAGNEAALAAARDYAINTEYTEYLQAGNENVILYPDGQGNLGTLVFDAYMSLFAADSMADMSVLREHPEAAYISVMSISDKTGTDEEVITMMNPDACIITGNIPSNENLSAFYNSKIADSQTFYINRSTLSGITINPADMTNIQNATTLSLEVPDPAIFIVEEETVAETADEATGETAEAGAEGQEAVDGETQVGERDLTEITVKVANGEYGTSQARFDNLRNAGYSSEEMDEIQKGVDYIYNNKMGRCVSVMFDTDGKTEAPHGQIISANTSAEEPEAPVAEGYTFTGWYKDKELTQPVDFSETFNSSLWLYAGWEAEEAEPEATTEPEVTAETAEDTAEAEQTDTTVEESSEAPADETEETEETAEVSEEESSETAETEEVPVEETAETQEDALQEAKDSRITAIGYSENTGMNGDAGMPESMGISTSESVSVGVTEEELEATGEDIEALLNETPENQDGQTDDVNVAEDVSAEDGAPVEESLTDDANVAEDVSAEDGASVEESLTDELTEVTEDLAQEAEVSDGYTVTFYTNGFGNVVDSQTVNEGGIVSVPAVPEDANMLFEGWYTDSACEYKYNFSTPVTSDLKLYAKWSPKTVTVQYDANGGTGTESGKTYNTSETVSTLENNYTNDGKMFTGWNTKADGTGTSYSIGDILNTSDFTDDSMTLYAQWKNAYGFSESNPSEYSKGEDLQLLLNGDISKAQSVEIDGTPIENATFTLKPNDEGIYVNIPKEAVENLENGDHQIKATFADGEAVSRVRVSASARERTFGNWIFWVAIAMFIAAITEGIILIKKKVKKNNTEDSNKES